MLIRSEKCRTEGQIARKTSILLDIRLIKRHSATQSGRLLDRSKDCEVDGQIAK